jgi:hypothetical protein
MNFLWDLVKAALGMLLFFAVIAFEQGVMQW